MLLSSLVQLSAPCGREPIRFILLVVSMHGLVRMPVCRSNLQRPPATTMLSVHADMLEEKARLPCNAFALGFCKALLHFMKLLLCYRLLFSFLLPADVDPFDFSRKYARFGPHACLPQQPAATTMFRVHAEHARKT